MTRAITVCQPFASLIATGAKWVENRKWPTRHRGPLLIHAATGKVSSIGVGTFYGLPSVFAEHVDAVFTHDGNGWVQQ